jgi:hypothetical protein
VKVTGDRRRSSTELGTTSTNRPTAFIPSRILYARSIRKALQAIVQHYIRLRNDIAHADWAVGWEVADTGELVPPAASKFKLAKDGIEHTSLPFTAEQLRREIDHLH